MKECHVCFYMCGDDDEICPICGAELKEKPAEEPEKTVEPAGIKNPVLAASVDSPVTAEIFKDILSESGIPYFEDGDGDIMHTGFGGSFFAVDIFVDESDLDEAQSLYKNLVDNEMTFEDFSDFDYEDGDK